MPVLSKNVCGVCLCCFVLFWIMELEPWTNFSGPGDIRKGIQPYKNFALATPRIQETAGYAMLTWKATVKPPQVHVLWSECAVETSLGPSTSAERAMQALRQGQHPADTDVFNNVICSLFHYQIIIWTELFGFEQPLNNLLLKMMRQTHIKIQTYRNNERVTNEFLCRIVLCVGSWNSWPRTRKLSDTRWSGKRWCKQCDGIHILLKRSWVDLEIRSSTVIIRSMYP